MSHSEIPCYIFLNIPEVYNKVVQSLHSVHCTVQLLAVLDPQCVLWLWSCSDVLFSAKLFPSFVFTAPMWFSHRSHGHVKPRAGHVLQPPSSAPRIATGPQSSWRRTCHCMMWYHQQALLLQQCSSLPVNLLARVPLPKLFNLAGNKHLHSTAVHCTQCTVIQARYIRHWAVILQIKWAGQLPF